MKYFTCELCNKTLTTANYKRHMINHKNHPERFNGEHYYINHTDLKCQFCGRLANRLSSLAVHEKYCKLNPNRKNGPWFGRHHTTESRLKTSAKMLNNTNSAEAHGGRGKKGWYKGFYCDSTYELAFIIYCLDHNVPITRCHEHYNYTYNNKNHKYYPDFLMEDNSLIEIKGYWTELVDIKTQAVHDREIHVLYPKDLKYVFDYIETTYGKVVDKNLSDLYEAR